MGKLCHFFCFTFFVLEVEVSRIVILIFAANTNNANSRAWYSRIPLIIRIVTNTANTSRIQRIIPGDIRAEYSWRILRRILGAFFEKKHKKSTKWSIFTIFVELFSPKSTGTGSRPRYSWYSPRIFAAANSAIIREYREYRDNSRHLYY